MPRTLVTGGAGYLGAVVVGELRRADAEVRVLDALRHGRADVAAGLEAGGAEVLRGDVRDPAVRAAALEGVEQIVHLAAIVGDPACALEPDLAQTVNVDASLALLEEAREAGVRRFVFASTCSNYGRLDDPSRPVDEDCPLAPVSLYARQKVEVERAVLAASGDGLETVCLRFATLFGIAPRMRFDLVVNEFALWLWAGRELEVYGAGHWRPYVHVADAAAAIALVLRAPAAGVAGRVFNAGRPGENHRKREIVDAVRRELPGRGSVRWVERDEDPRDYSVSFDRIAGELGFAAERSVADGVREVVGALDAGRIADPFSAAHRNVP